MPSSKSAIISLAKRKALPSRLSGYRNRMVLSKQKQMRHASNIIFREAPQPDNVQDNRVGTIAHSCANYDRKPDCGSSVLLSSDISLLAGSLSREAVSIANYVLADKHQSIIRNDYHGFFSKSFDIGCSRLFICKEHSSN